ncbi:MAG: hypothetical protein Kow0098_19150 [Ignavibacteriaceae bacterium]
MICPRCKSSFIILELDRVEVDYCPDCGGVWLDAGELELLLSKDQQIDPFINSFNPVRQTSELKLKCPVCSKKMSKGIIGDSKITLDKCNKDHGFWFDKGELEGVLKSANSSGSSRIIKILKEIFASKN